MLDNIKSICRVDSYPFWVLFNFFQHFVVSLFISKSSLKKMTVEMSEKTSNIEKKVKAICARVLHLDETVSNFSLPVSFRYLLLSLNTDFTSLFFSFSITQVALIFTYKLFECLTFSNPTTSTSST